MNELVGNGAGVEVKNAETYMLPDVLQPFLHFLRSIPFRNEKLIFDDARLLFACFSRVSCVTNLRYFDRVLMGESWECLCVEK